MNDGKGQSLGELVTLVRGNTYKSRLLGKSGPVLLGLASIQRHGGFRDDKLKCYAGPSKQEHLIGPGELFVSLKDVTQSAELLGAVAMVPPSVGEGRLTQDTVHLKMTYTQPSKSFIYWSLRTPQYRRYCLACSMGTTNLSLSRNDFLDWRLPEVNNSSLTLVSLLEDLEAKIDLLKRQNNTLQGMAETLFRQWFIEEAQEDWETWLSGDLMNFLDPHPSHRAPAETNDNPIPFLGIGDISEGGVIDRVKSRGVAFEISEEQKDNYTLLKESVGLGRVGTVGKVVRLHRRHLPFALSPTLCVVNPLHGIRHWHLYLLRSRSFQGELLQLNSGSTRPSVGLKNLRQIEIALPSIDRLKEFDDTIDQIEERVNLNLREIDGLVSKRNTLLPKLMSGEVRVQMD